MFDFISAIPAAGSVINALAVIAGSLIGLIIKKRLPERITMVAFQVIGLSVLALGIQMTLQSKNVLIMILSLLLGAILGEALELEDRLQNGLKGLRTRMIERGWQFGGDHLVEGFLTAFLLFCMGSMAILGAFEEGVGKPPNLLLVKSMMDLVSSIALASTLGIGVLFSAIPLLLYQGGLTLGAFYLNSFISNALIDEITAVGGVLLLGLGFSLLHLKHFKVFNMIPSLLLVVIFSLFL
ncbi:MAG: DUF554 domain-containing protein [Acetomicrobium sp.]|jgi:hypothetical protein|uniref:Membrane protein YdfK n=2 Tax=Acetomicrobium TaxID=49894 RepID=A0A0T5XBH0_9BACT|nr:MULTISPECIES: DUF554 domain-containing protein [Acetomicrobium]KRT35674.1 hypothetical protein HMPREF1705_02916 [Acetomicrobium hydrogeniformans ATCC BAA-1850]MBC7322442.1 DUF554 domain-containing protein [Acetomicrobium sp.]SDY06779.1 hypothetical protein SAMN03080603_01655 [Acetomicrobium thermoterrenum DSM 13490]